MSKGFSHLDFGFYLAFELWNLDFYKNPQLKLTVNFHLAYNPFFFDILDFGIGHFI